MEDLSWGVTEGATLLFQNEKGDTVRFLAGPISFRRMEKTCLSRDGCSNGFSQTLQGPNEIRFVAGAAKNEQGILQESVHAYFGDVNGLTLHGTETVSDSVTISGVTYYDVYRSSFKNAHREFGEFNLSGFYYNRSHGVLQYTLHRGAGKNEVYSIIL